MIDNIKRFPNGTAKPFLSPAEYSQLRDDDRFLYNEGIGMTDQLAKDALTETARLSQELDVTNADNIALWLDENAAAAPDYRAWLAVRIVEAHERAVARIEAEALARGRMEGAKAMQEAVILKLDECCEPCFQCNQNVTALDPAVIVKGLNDAD